MGTQWKRGHKDQGPKAKARRQGALTRLEEQVKTGTKPVNQVKNAFVGYESSDPLEEKDKKRIKKEIAILQTRV